MPVYSFNVFANADFGWPPNGFSQSGTIVAGATHQTMHVRDDDAVFDDEYNGGGGETLDSSEQVLDSAIGIAPAGNAVQSVYRWNVTNTTTGESGYAHLIRIYSSSTHGGGSQLGQYYVAFTIAVDQGDSLTLSNATPIGQVAYADLYEGQPALQATDDIFAEHGKHGFLALVANAAYRHALSEIADPHHNWAPSAAATAAYDTVRAELKVLTDNDLPSLTQQIVGNVRYPVRGLSDDGIYTNLNAAALVARSQDALFVSFRGTNDKRFFADPGDRNDWLDMDGHFAKFDDLIAALRTYAQNDASIQRIYVAGHSLGGAMAQALMDEWQNAVFSGRISIQGATFASPGYPALTGADDGRTVNYVIAGDPVPLSDVGAFHENHGNDLKVILLGAGLLNTVAGWKHSMALYSQVVDHAEVVTGLSMDSIMRNGVDGVRFDNLLVRLSSRTGDTDFVIGGTEASNMDGYVSGQLGNEIIVGGRGVDRIDGHFLSSTYAAGGEGNDIINGGNLRDWLFGGQGIDKLNGGYSKDKLYGGADGDSIWGDSGNDTIHGDDGADWLSGETDDDAIYGGIGNDTMFGGTGNDTLTGGADNDSMEGGLNDDTLYGQTGQDTLIGGMGDDALYGGAHNDSIVGGTGDDTIYGDGGSDVMTGGWNADIFVFRSAPEMGDGFSRDRITDFDPGSDLIDLSAMGLVWRGGASFTGTSAEVRFAYGANGLLQVDSNGDGLLDGAVVLTGVSFLGLDDLIL